MIGFETLQIMLFLIPGFFSEVILNILVTRKNEKDLRFIVEALMFSIFTYSLFAYISNTSPVTLSTSNQFIFDPKSILMLMGIAIIWPSIIAVFITHDIHMWIIRKLNLSKLTSRSSTWQDVFSDKVVGITINFSDGRRLSGFPEYYSNDPDHQHLYLSYPHWIDEDRRYIKLNVDGILITPDYKINTIEFHKKEK
jgi:hypothetical protein